MPISAPGDVSGLRDTATQKSQHGERLATYLEDAHGALSGHTVRAVRADLERFTAWCAERGLAPLPARPATVVAYIEAMASGRAPATVRRYVSSVATVHKATGERSLLEHVTVRRALTRMHRRKGWRQTQVQGLTWALRQRLVEAAGHRLIDVRNRAILAVAYDAMLRRSELVALQVVDVTIERGGSASLLVRRAKTDPEGGGAMLYVHDDSVTLVRACLFAHLRDLPTPLRVANLPGYLRSLGLSPNPWPSTTLQGTPMRYRGEHLGHFFLSDKDDGEAFTGKDEEILVLFAAQAATAVANARTYRDVERARADLAALIETSPVGVVVFDAATGQPVSFNREARRLVEGLRTPGRPPEQLLEVITCRHADGRAFSLEALPLAKQLEGATTMRAEEVELSVPDGGASGRSSTSRPSVPRADRSSRLS